MPEVTVYVPAMKLKVIDSHCKEKKISRSRLLIRGAMAIINQAPKKRCKFCSKPAMGKFKVSYYDMDVGDSEEEVYLCGFHLQQAQRTQEVEEL